METKCCPECDHPMIAGRRMDQWNPGFGQQEVWLKGAPKMELFGVFSGEGNAIPVITYACMECGRLVSYLQIKE